MAKLTKIVGTLAQQNSSLKADMRTMVEDVGARLNERTEKHLAGFEILYPESMVKRFKTISYISLLEMNRVMAKGVTALPSTRSNCRRGSLSLWRTRRERRSMVLLIFWNVRRR